MRNYFGITVLAAVFLGLAGCNSKKEVAVGEEFKYNPGACAVADIKVDPAKMEDSTVFIGSNREVKFSAAAYDKDGKPVNARLTWSFRYPDGDNEQKSGGHELAASDERHVRFRASGMTPGVFAVVAEDRTCDLTNSDEPQYPRGEAWIRVYDPPDAQAACGMMRVTYGDRIDRMGDTVIASAKVLLLAEVSGHEKLSRKYRVRFYVNDKPNPDKRPLYFDQETEPLPGWEVGHFAMLPLYIVPGSYSVRYELLENGQIVCGSRTERFKAR
jgi:hypothetical protein